MADIGMADAGSPRMGHSGPDASEEQRETPWRGSNAHRGSTAHWRITTAGFAILEHREARLAYHPTDEMLAFNEGTSPPS